MKKTQILKILAKNNWLQPGIYFIDDEENDRSYYVMTWLDQQNRLEVTVCDFETDETVCYKVSGPLFVV